jgi:hypothetical protein
MSDDIVAAHLAAALIHAGSQKLDAKTAATIYFDCLEAVRAERQKRYEPPKGGTGRAQPATARRSGSGLLPRCAASVIPAIKSTSPSCLTVGCVSGRAGYPGRSGLVALAWKRRL